MDFIAEMFNLMAVVVHRKIRGEVDVRCIKTDKTIELVYMVQGVRYVFRSQQYIYQMRSTGWMTGLRTSYVYKVKLVVAPGDTVSDQSLGIYQNQCPNFLKNTTYPHRLAINAHFKRVTQSVYPDFIIENHEAGDCLLD